MFRIVLISELNFLGVSDALYCRFIALCTTSYYSNRVPHWHCTIFKTQLYSFSVCRCGRGFWKYLPSNPCYATGGAMLYIHGHCTFCI